MSTPTLGTTHTTTRKPGGVALLVIGIDHGTRAAGLAIYGSAGLRWSEQVHLKPDGPEHLGLRLGELAAAVRHAYTVCMEAVSLEPSFTRLELRAAVEKPIGYTGRRSGSSGGGGGGHRARKGLAAGVDWAALAARGMSADDGKSDGAQGRGTGIVGAGYGVVLLTCAELGIPVRAIYPATAKSALAGDGRAGKVEMIASARRFMNHDPGPDEADAIGLAMAGYNVFWPELQEQLAIEAEVSRGAGAGSVRA